MKMRRNFLLILLSCALLLSACGIQSGLSAEEAQQTEVANLVAEMMTQQSLDKQKGTEEPEKKQKNQHRKLLKHPYPKHPHKKFFPLSQQSTRLGRQTSLKMSIH